MKRFLTRSTSFAGLVVLLLIIFLTLIINVYFYSSRGRFKTDLRKNLFFDVSYQTLFYIFPNKFIIRKIVIEEDFKRDFLSSDKLSISTVVANISLVRLLAKGEIVITDINAYHGDINYGFLARNFERIKDILLILPYQDVVIRFRDTILDLTGTDDKFLNYLSSDFDLILKKGLFSLKGQLRRYIYTAKGVFPFEEGQAPLHFDFRAKLLPEEIRIEKVFFASGQIYSQTWGQVKEDTLELNGFALLSSNEPEIKLTRLAKERKSHLRMLLKKIGHEPTREFNIDPNVYMFDLESRVKLDWAKLSIEKIKFSLNNMLVLAQGAVELGQEAKLNGKIWIDAQKSGISRNQNFKEAQIDIAGTYQQKTFHGETSMVLSFNKDVDSVRSPNKIELACKGVDFTLNSVRHFKMLIAEMNAAFFINKNVHKLVVKDIDSAISLPMARYKYFKVQAPFYDGFLQGNVWVDMSDLPLKFISILKLSGARSEKLVDFTKHFAAFQGELSSIIRVRNDPELEIKGDINMRKGIVSNYDFLNWLADTFALPSVRNLDFYNSSVKFWVARKKEGLPGILFKSKLLGLKGYYFVDKDNLVSSKLAVTFSRKLTKESPKMRSIFGVFDKTTPALTLDFQLSGNRDALNFQWLPSETKKKIQDRIPNFIERGIERRIDSMMEAPPSNTKEEEK